MSSSVQSVLCICAVLGLGACERGYSLAPTNNNNENSSVDCGDGVLDPAEQCDGAELDGQTCVGLGFDGGVLACTSACTFDTGGCQMGSECGDGVAEGSEECDADDFGGASCQSLGWDGGILACDAACHYDPSGCQGTGPVCGNDAQEYGEDCDGADLGGETCVSQGFSSGTLACAADCVFDTDECVSQICGNGAIEEGEDCDGADLNGETCVGLGFDSGTLACAGDCRFDMGACESVTCPNGVIDAGEDCDGGDLGGQTCGGLGYVGGTLACAGNCVFDEGGCLDEICGNGSREGTEACDTGDLDGETCVSQGFAAGTLACDTNCDFDTTGCYVTFCGNNTIEPPEECDGIDLGGLDCTNLGYTGGTLGCTPNCLYSVSNCTGTPACTAEGGSLACGAATGGDTSGPPAAANITDWIGPNCSPYPYTGPEIIYIVNTGGTSEGVTVSLTGLSGDLDLIVMQSAGLGCDPGLPCVGYSARGGVADESVSFVSAVNTDYFVVVDGYAGAVSPYNLDVVCSQPTRMIYEWFPLGGTEAWDLEGSTITFTPNSTVPMGYLYSVATGVTGFPSPPMGMTPSLPFAGSDDTIEVPFPPGRSFTFFDVTYTSMWVNTNGNITFGGGDPEPEESAVLFAGGLPRIAGEWDNINPVAGGPSTVLVQPSNDRVAVTWNYSPDNFAGQGDHAIQIELFWAGSVAITNLTNGGTDGLCGITEGGGPPLQEVNFVP